MWLSNAGSKYMEYISRIRNTEMKCLDNNKINEIMLQYVKSFNQAEWKQYTIYNPTKQMKLRRNLGGNCMKAKGDCQD
jgi:competence protein ComGF